MKIAGILFDKDGVLVDFQKTWVDVAVAMAHDWAGGDEKRAGELLHMAGYQQASHSFAAGSVWAAGNTDDLVSVWNQGGSARDARQLAQFINHKCHQAVPVPVVPIADLQGLFGKLHRAGFRLGLATNDVEASARAAMGLFGLDGMLDIIIGYDSIDDPKPAAGPVLAFCEHCALAPAQVLMIGDNLHDMEMASRAGCGLRAGVLSGNSTAEMLSPHADFMLDSVLDLPQELRKRKLM